MWKTSGTLMTLQTPQGVAVLACWANPSYVHGVILPASGADPIPVPQTDWHANQDHIPHHLRRKYDSAFAAAQAYCEWKLGTLVPADSGANAYDLLDDTV